MELKEGELICKYVECNGEKIGESLDVYEGYLILKKEGDFVGVPLDQISEVKEDTIILERFDMDAGLKIGEKWREEKSKPVSLEDLDLG